MITILERDLKRLKRLRKKSRHLPTSILKRLKNIERRETNYLLLETSQGRLRNMMKVLKEILRVLKSMQIDALRT
jgi:hypothetical protein